MTPDTTVSGAPISIGNWQPHNYDGSLGNGDLPLKMALAKSMNVPAVHLLQPLHPDRRPDGRRFGIKCPWRPTCRRHSVQRRCLLIRWFSAYSGISQQGDTRRAPRDSSSIGIAMVRLSKSGRRRTYKVVNQYGGVDDGVNDAGVVQFGNGNGCELTWRTVGRQTGTVNDHTDVWFIGIRRLT